MSLSCGIGCDGICAPVAFLALQNALGAAIDRKGWLGWSGPEIVRLGAIWRLSVRWRVDSCIEWVNACIRCVYGRWNDP